MRGGGGLKAYLEKIGKTMPMAEVGIMEQATYPDGESVAQVGYWNEYGHTGVIPSRSQLVYRSLNERTGEFNKNGKFVKKDKSNFASWVTIPSYTVDVPARPFFRTAIENNRGKLPEMAAALMKKHDYDVEHVVALLSEHMVDELHVSVMTWTTPPNTKATQAKKGVDAPLRDSMLLSRSFSYEVFKDGSKR